MVDFAEPPSDAKALGSFPTRTLKVGTPIHRIHHAELGPFWFGSAQDDAAGGGRFDLPTPLGSSYWSLQPQAAFLETIARRPISVIPLEVLDRYALTTVSIPRPIEAANSPVQRSRAFGLTAEFHTTPNYAPVRRWAHRLYEAGHRSLLAIPRHDVTARLRTLTLFGRGGEHRPTGWAKTTSTAALPPTLTDAMAAWGIRCLPIPFDVETL